MKGQKRCYSLRSEVTITVIKQFESSFSYSLPSQAGAALGQPGGERGTRHHSAGCWLGGFAWTPASGREGAMLQQCPAAPVRGLSSPAFAQNVCVPVCQTALAPPSSTHLELASFWVRNQTQVPFRSSWARYWMKLSELFTASELKILKYL